MKTIEERAANLAKEFATGKQNRETAVYRSCIQMATEQREIDVEEFHPIMEENVLKAINKQKQIDIDNACKYLKKLGVFSMLSFHDEEGVSQEVYEDMFRKAMEV